MAIILSNALSQLYTDFADTNGAAYIFVNFMATISDLTTELCFETCYIIRFRAFVTDEKYHKWLWCLLTVPVIYSFADIIGIYILFVPTSELAPQYAQIYAACNLLLSCYNFVSHVAMCALLVRHLTAQNQIDTINKYSLYSPGNYR
jgi:hypothetical protein